MSACLRHQSYFPTPTQVTRGRQEEKPRPNQLLTLSRKAISFRKGFSPSKQTSTLSQMFAMIPHSSCAGYLRSKVFHTTICRPDPVHQCTLLSSSNCCVCGERTDWPNQCSLTQPPLPHRCITTCLLQKQQLSEARVFSVDFGQRPPNHELTSIPSKCKQIKQQISSI